MSWQSWEDAAEKGPVEFITKLGCAALALTFFLVVIVGSVSYALSWFGEAATVVKDELGPRTLLNRYQWFKDAAAQLDGRVASIKLYEQRFENLKAAYEGQPRSKWSREDREQANLWEQEVAGIKASYNALAAEYNAAMAKINWRFCNVGDLPPGADRVLPREFREYLSK